ncbi:ABC transporter substrate-binding protein [candidate division KSB3 bacterium]|uniref:ABC transporter substrate-binding protein n=1 Tax=candidate division KSB3 bacterium TaxID=2044937 RepID=A0A9D5JZU4_9BACT|nr:ABC transporter substrate-binding protein [candidate division KSB3 bacterium]MBD3326816.1 ABC transporter substrate-binding protein [candidate division KSB3 bacterium]
MKTYQGKTFRLAVIVAIVCVVFGGYVGTAAACKVLVVSAYHESFFRTLEINEGIEEVLGTECDLTYVYLDSLTDPAGVEAKAQEALRQYQAIQPDGVIAVGEDAQSAFVVPYLQEKVTTPVMFNNIFFPEVYEYPSANVSGMQLRWPIEDAIVFIQQIIPAVERVGFLFADEPAGHAVIEQISREKETYPTSVLDPVVVKTAEEAVEQAARLNEQCDALYIGPVSMLPGTSGGAFSSEKVLFSAVKQAFGKATFTNLEFYVEAGLLCGVRDFGQEQGRGSAEMLQQAMSGTPVSELPIAQNQFGQRILNKTVLKELGIKPSRRILTGAEIVETMQ